MAAKPRRIPDVLTEDEEGALLRQPNPRCTTGLRNLCMMTVMLDAGLRVSETLNLCVRDIDWTTGRLLVKQGKGKKDRALWLNEDALALLGQWRERRGLGGNALMFTTLKGERLDTSYMRRMVKRLAARAGITGKNIHPHTLRHTFATDIYRQTKNIRLTQKALGHSDLSTTMIYTHIVDDELEDAMKTFRRR